MDQSYRPPTSTTNAVRPYQLSASENYYSPNVSSLSSNSRDSPLLPSDVRSEPFGQDVHRLQHLSPRNVVPPTGGASRLNAKTSVPRLLPGLHYDIVPRRPDGPSVAEMKLAALTQQLENEMNLGGSIGQISPPISPLPPPPNRSSYEQRSPLDEVVIVLFVICH